MAGLFFFFVVCFYKNNIQIFHNRSDHTRRLLTTGRVTSWCQWGNNNTRGPASRGPDMRVGWPCPLTHGYLPSRGTFKGKTVKDVAVSCWLTRLIVCRPGRRRWMPFRTVRPADICSLFPLFLLYLTRNSPTLRRAWGWNAGVPTLPWLFVVNVCLDSPQNKGGCHLQ